MVNPKDYFAGHSHSCDVGIACLVGLEAAHVFNHIVYWLRNNAAKNKAKIINNRHWMYETQKEISDCLGYLSEDQVCRAIKKLVEVGYLIAENHHEDKFKKTNWYAIFDDEIFLKDLGNKKMFTKPRNRGIDDSKDLPSENDPICDFQRSAISRNGDRESAECIYKEQEDKLHNYKTTTTSECVVPLDKEKKDKLKELSKIKISHGLVESSMKYSIDEIKLAIECCLNSIESIKDMDAYYWSALTKKWQPKPNKAKIEAIHQQNQEQQQKNRQKVYLEAKQLEMTHKYNLKEPASFSVNENTIMIKINNGHCPYELTEESLKILKKYIRDNQKK